MQQSYEIRSWRGWDRHIDTCVDDFRGRFGVAPNVMVASPVTLRRLNVAADKSHVGNGRGEVPDAHAYVELAGFAGADYQLSFFKDDKVAPMTITLVYAESDPDGGEPMPVEDTAPLKKKRRAR